MPSTKQCAGEIYYFHILTTIVEYTRDLYVYVVICVSKFANAPNVILNIVCTS